MPGKLFEAITPSLNGGGPLGIHTTIVNSGWEAFVNTGTQGPTGSRSIAECAEWGGSGHRFLLHLPHGQDPPGNDYRMDIYYDAARAGLSNVVSSRGFNAAWKPIIDGGIEVACYLGKANGTPRVAQEKRYRRYDNWLGIWRNALRMPLDAGMSIAIDASSEFESTDAEFYFYEAIRAAGVTCYIETASNESRFVPYKQIILEDFYQANIEQLWMPRSPTEYAELVRWEQTPAVWSAASIAATVETIQGDGHTAAIPVGWLQDGYARADFE